MIFCGWEAAKLTADYQWAQRTGITAWAGADSLNPNFHAPNQITHHWHHHHHGWDIYIDSTKQKTKQQHRPYPYNHPVTRYIFYIILLATISHGIKSVLKCKSNWYNTRESYYCIYRPTINQIIGRVPSQSSSASQTGTTPESPTIASTTQADGPIPSDTSSKPSHTPIIVGSIIAGIFVILSILLLIWRYKKKSRLHLPFTSGLQDGKASKKATQEVKSYDLKHMSIHYASQVHPHSVIDGNEESVLNLPRNSVTSTIITTSALTERQIQLRDETEALRDQIKILQRAVLSSNVEVQREMARMGAHMQRLEIFMSLCRLMIGKVINKYTNLKSMQNMYAPDAREIYIRWYIFKSRFFSKFMLSKHGE
ncbi:hypothetical protein K435DRAFT_943221 [Dendrothele bispora CBS 962.96]|uniref:Uncharacterized protein n=1 Tax=Dendrothele bispora (strain CBS 962.96) TaxID=1314807 RepID=A0A4S8KU77_DENBC|nr:hypothetical protein K435DRAFT_943221 [Dendrothele bispora CBS 962.96]